MELLDNLKFSSLMLFLYLKKELSEVEKWKIQLWKIFLFSRKLNFLASKLETFLYFWR